VLKNKYKIQPALGVKNQTSQHLKVFPVLVWFVTLFLWPLS